MAEIEKITSPPFLLKENIRYHDNVVRKYVVQKKIGNLIPSLYPAYTQSGYRLGIYLTIRSKFLVFREVCSRLNRSASFFFWASFSLKLTRVRSSFEGGSGMLSVVTGLELGA